MVDLGDDFDVEGAVVGEVARLLAEEFVEPAQIFGAAFDRYVGHSLKRGKRSAAGPGQDHARGAGGHDEPAGDPGRGHQGRHGDVQHLHRAIEADPRREGFEHVPQRVLRELAGDEVDAFAGVGHRRRADRAGGGRRTADRTVL